MNEIITQKVKGLPNRPGVYLMKDYQNNVIYVGKAKILKNRVSQYFQNSEKLIKVQNMVDKISDFDYFVVNSELDALALESNLIKKYQPFYNILLKDNKAYQYIHLNNDCDFPYFNITRRLTKKGKFFGPYFAGIKATELLNSLSFAYPLVRCEKKFKTTSPLQKTCLYYDMNMCSAPCGKKISKEDYLKIVSEAVNFLKGDIAKIKPILIDKMQKASISENFETAIKLRDSISMIDRLGQKVISELPTLCNYDIFCVAQSGSLSAVCTMIVRGGKMVGINSMFVKNYTLDIAEFYLQFLSAYYIQNGYSCDEIIIPTEIDTAALTDLIKQKYEKNIKISVPKKGVKKQLIDTCYDNARLHIEKNTESEQKQYETTIGAIQQLQSELHLKNTPKRIECYDISNTFGSYTVASMAVLIDGKKSPNHYRKFKIKNVDFIDDFASMEEVLTRRFEKLNSDDASFSCSPDLILIDGGKGQLSSAKKIKQKLNINTPIISLAKRLEEVFTEESNISILLPKGSYALRVLQLARDEAHRIAITFNRQLRDKGTYKGGLIGIENVGKVTRRNLLACFKTIDNIKFASIEELINCAGVSKKSAKSVYDFFHKTF